MQHKFGPALEAAERAVAADTGSAEARGTLLEAAIAAGRYDEADAAAARIDQRSVAGLARRALWLDAQGRTETALSLMTDACRELERTEAPAQASAWCLTQAAGMTHSLRGPDAAETIYRRVLELDPGNRGGVEGLANLALGRGRPRDALDGFSAIRSDAHPDLYLRIAEAYRQLGRPDSAALAERRFLAIAGVPENEALFGNVLALFQAERGDPQALDSALAIAKREVARRPTNESHDLLAWVYYRRGETEPAVAASDRSLRWGRLNPTMTFHRGTILAAAGRGAEAGRLLAEAIQVPTLLAPHLRALIPPRPSRS
jgi:tetratricopeptide (TPR) repeat protein